MQQDLVDLSLSNTFSIAKLNSFSIKSKANSAKLIDMPMSHQSVMIHLNNGSSQFVVKYIFLLGSEGAHTACRFIVKLDAAAKSVQAVHLPMLPSVPTPHLKEQELHQDVKNTLSLISPLNNHCQSREHVLPQLHLTKHSSLLAHLIIPRHSSTSGKVSQYFVRETKRVQTMEK